MDQSASLSFSDDRLSPVDRLRQSNLPEVLVDPLIRLAGEHSKRDLRLRPIVCPGDKAPAMVDNSDNRSALRAINRPQVAPIDPEMSAADPREPFAGQRDFASDWRAADGWFLAGGNFR